MFKLAVIVAFFALAFSSCGFWFYNYRARIDTEFVLPNSHKDSMLRYAACQTIFRLARKSEIYHSYVGQRCDTLYFYGPDYHKLKFKLHETDSATVIRFYYSGYQGWRGRPPHQQFIASLRDSLRIRFKGKELVKMDVNNQKTKRRKK